MTRKKENSSKKGENLNNSKTSSKESSPNSLPDCATNSTTESAPNSLPDCATNSTTESAPNSTPGIARDILLSKILGGEAEIEEILYFAEWIKEYKNELYFEKFREMWHVSVDASYRKSQSGRFNSKRFVAYIRKSEKRKKIRIAFAYSVSAAASIALLITLSAYLNLWSPGQKSVRDFSLLSFSADSVRVELNNGEFIKKMKGSSGSLSVVEERADDISLTNLSATTEESLAKVYNTISTPPGERVAIMLSDETIVYLTSNSYLKYPSRFDKKSREVTLVGRAYFEVKKSSVPFIVNTSDMNIEVLGTSFDVESRSNGTSSSVILVEGSVKVLADGKSKIIYPNEQMSLHRQTKEMTVKSVDSKLMTMWKDGVLIVHGQTFKELTESLASWYGVVIEDRTKVSQTERFNGRFDREDIEAAIKAVCISAAIDYKIENGRLILEEIRNNR